jgi:alpha-2-macroglobulin
MHLARLLIATWIVPTVLGAQPRPLTVLSHTPTSTANGSQIVTVIFDRPVAGRLDETVPAKGLLRVEPAIAGRVEWRDPITIRLVPEAPLTPGTTYQVVVDTSFRAVDGGQLVEPYRFSFRARGPALLWRSFDDRYGGTQMELPYNRPILLLYSTPVDVTHLEREARIEVDQCRGAPARSVRLRVLRQREVRQGDPSGIYYAGGWDRDRTTDRFRRVVELEASRPLPPDCPAQVVLPNTEDDRVHGALERFARRTASDFRILAANCSLIQRCAMDGFTLTFTSPVWRKDVVKHVRMTPGTTLELAPGADSGRSWRVNLPLRPRTTYTVTASPKLLDVHGRSLVGDRQMRISTGDLTPALGHATGIVTVPRSGSRSLPLRHVNVRRVFIVSAPIPEHARATFLSGAVRGIDSTILKLASLPETTIVALDAPFNVERTTEVPIPSRFGTAASGLVVMRIEPLELMSVPLVDSIVRPVGIRQLDTIVVRSPAPTRPPPTYLVVQLTDLAAHVKIGSSGGTAFVTRRADGAPIAGALVRQIEADGRVVATARTESDGVARLRANSIGADSSARDARTRATRVGYGIQSGASLVDVQLDADRLVTLVAARYLGWDYWEGLPAASIGGRSGMTQPHSATLFVDRGIYRPGERIYLKGVVRTGPLGALVAPVGDSVRVMVKFQPTSYEDTDVAVVHDTTLVLSEFGTIADSLTIGPSARLGRYMASLELRGHTLASESLQVAEYRAPEFLLEARADSAPHYGGDTVRFDVEGRYLFGAPMTSSAIEWTASIHETMPWELRIPGTEGWSVGDWNWWDSDDRSSRPALRVAGTATLDARGRATVHVPLAELRSSRPGRLAFETAVTDVNRQAVSAQASASVHPARLYLLARDAAKRWYWTVGRPTAIEFRSILPTGVDTTGVSVNVTLVRRRMRWEGRWLSTDSVLRRDTMRTVANIARFTFVPRQGDLYEVRLSASDGRGGVARTTVSAWAFEGGPRWNARTAHHLPLVADRRTLAVDDTTSVIFDSPFDEAEALVTVEREGILEQARSVVRRGPNTVPLRITGAHVPNVFVSVMLVRRSRDTVATRPDSVAQLFRVGFAELKVAANSKRLMVDVRPAAREYLPGDTALVKVRVRGADGRGVRSEVTLWAVDEGVLALTDHSTPDLIDRLYVPRGLGARMASSLASALTSKPPMIAPTLIQLRGATSSARLSEVVVTGATPAPGGPSMVDVSMRTRFRSTAFFVAAAHTDVDGNVRIRAGLPDNITTFRLMAIAIDRGERFGSGDSTLLVSRQLVARPTLPRFVRASDTLLAGAVVNVRDGGSRLARIEAESEGITLQGDPRQVVTLAAGKGAEVRFAFTVPPRDSVRDTVVVRLRAADGSHGDAVQTSLPVRPDFHARSHTAIGVLRQAADVELMLPAGIDAARSRLSLRVGTSPLAPMLAAYDWLRVYPYHCTEQIASGGLALLAVWKATNGREPRAMGDAREHVQQLVDEIVRRQRSDGAIRYWNDHHWTSPWLAAYAGIFLLEAREAGFAVDSAVIDRAADWLGGQKLPAPDSGGMNRIERRHRRLHLANNVAVVDFLRRAGAPDLVMEDELLRLAPAMTWEDRLRLSEVLASRDDHRVQVHELVDAAWRAVRVAGNRVDLPDSAHAERHFPSRSAPSARLLTATLAVRPEHALLGGLIETVLMQGRAERRWAWSTQDYAGVVLALARLSSTEDATREIRVLANDRELLSGRQRADSSVRLPLTGLLSPVVGGEMQLRLRLEPSAGRAPMFYALTVDEVPSAAPVTPDAKGIIVERWYERFADGRPVTSVREGELVRVRLRVTVPSDREFVAVEDPIPAGLEPVDLSLATSGTLSPFTTPVSDAARERAEEENNEGQSWQAWLYGRWENGWWSPWEHRALHDDRVVYFARMLWAGSYSASYVARATTSGSFVRPPAHAEEMYNPAVQGRSDGGRFEVTGTKR